MTATGQKWIIVGGNRGIGFGLAEHLANAKPEDTIFATTRDLDSSPALQKLASKYDDGRVIPIQADFNDTSLAPNTLAAIRAHTTTLDHVIIVAGTMGDFAPIAQQTTENLTQTLGVNVVAAHHAIQTLAPIVQSSDNRHRSISVISSVASSLGFLEANIAQARSKLQFEEWPLAAYAVTKSINFSRIPLPLHLGGCFLHNRRRRGADAKDRAEYAGAPMGVAPRAKRDLHAHYRAVAGVVATGMSNNAKGTITPQEAAVQILRLIEGRDFEKAKMGLFSERYGTLVW